MPQVCAVVMAGGRGERFWPQSRLKRPKQFLNLTGNGTMIQEAVRRILPLVPAERVFVVTGSDYADTVREQLGAIKRGPGAEASSVPPENVIVEPEGKNTAPCLGLAASILARRYPDRHDLVMVVLAADHLIKDEPEFLRVLGAAAELAASRRGVHVTLGIWPSYAETGYGYIELAGQVAEDGWITAYAAAHFTEKPDKLKAQRFLAGRKHLWNSGMFVWRVDTLRQSIDQHLPGLAAGLRIVDEALAVETSPAVAAAEVAGAIRAAYQLAEPVSIDYGIMEKVSDIMVLPGNFGWDDVGSWLALERILPADDHENVVVGSHIGIDTTGCIVFSEKRLVATVGVENLIVVETDDATLICRKERAQEVKRVLAALRESGETRYL